MTHSLTHLACMPDESIPADCPHEDGPYHMWTCDGPFTVTCDNCGADGRITMTSGPEEDS